MTNYTKILLTRSYLFYFYLMIYEYSIVNFTQNLFISSRFRHLPHAFDVRPLALAN